MYCSKKDHGQCVIIAARLFNGNALVCVKIIAKRKKTIALEHCVQEVEDLVWLCGSDKRAKALEQNHTHPKKTKKKTFNSPRIPEESARVAHLKDEQKLIYNYSFRSCRPETPTHTSLSKLSQCTLI